MSNKLFRQTDPNFFGSVIGISVFFFKGFTKLAAVVGLAVLGLHGILRRGGRVKLDERKAERHLVL